MVFPSLLPFLVGGRGQLTLASAEGGELGVPAPRVFNLRGVHPALRGIDPRLVAVELALPGPGVPILVQFGVDLLRLSDEGGVHPRLRGIDPRLVSVELALFEPVGIVAVYPPVEGGDVTSQQTKLALLVSVAVAQVDKPRLVLPQLWVNHRAPVFQLADAVADSVALPRLVPTEEPGSQRRQDEDGQQPPEPAQVGLEGLRVGGRRRADAAVDGPVDGRKQLIALDVGVKLHALSRPASGADVPRRLRAVELPLRLRAHGGNLT